MRRVVFSFLSATVLSVASAQVIMAADMPVKAPIAVSSPYNWTGLYLGINGGGGWGKSTFTYSPSGTDVGHNDGGGLIGGTVGYNYQLPSNWVLGVEGDWDWANIKGSSSCPNPAFSCNTNIKSIATLRGRVGYAWNQWLVFATGGAAWGSVKVETVNLAGTATPTSGTASNSTTNTASGWTLGAGVEYGFWNNWSAKLEYLYVSLPTNTYTVDNSLLVNSRQHESLIRAGLNYRFNWMR